MSEIEELLRQERGAELPPPPDVRYTEAAVRRRLTQASRQACRLEENLSVMSGVGVLVLLIGASLLFGRAPLWLLAFPMGALCLFPLLLKRRESR